MHLINQDRAFGRAGEGFSQPHDERDGRVEMGIVQFNNIGEFSWMKQKVVDGSYRVRNLNLQTADLQKIRLS